jgi:hypothetical protein
MFLKFYLDVMLGMTTTFQDQNLGAFNLYAYYLRACVPSKARRDAVDEESQEMQRRIDSGEFGDTAKKQAEFLRGFCVVTASVNFLNDAFKITTNDASALADSTDEDALLQLEKRNMYLMIRKDVKDKRKRDLLDVKVFQGEIGTVKDLVKVIEDAKKDDPDEEDGGDVQTEESESSENSDEESPEISLGEEEEIHE